MALASIPEAINALRAGRPIIVVDDETRENEGDVVFSAALATPEVVAWTVRISSGFICAPLTSEIAEKLYLPPMISHNEDPRGTAYTVSIDAADRYSTGISASDRAHTLNLLAHVDSTPQSFTRPGHILPLVAVEGGVLERDGHTEAAVDLMILAGLPPVAGIAEVVRQDGEMARLDDLIDLGTQEDVLVITIEDLIYHLKSNPL